MKILLVEDDGYKQDRLEGLIRSCDPSPCITVAVSVRDAVQALERELFDHIFLDIALPSHTERKGGGGSLPMPSGGVEVLLELSYQDRSEPVTIITQYNEIEFDRCVYPVACAKQILSRELNVNIEEVVQYRRDERDWEERAMKGIKTDG